ncbi:CHAT domain-containing protein [Streptomyces justiciae]|uniref:CHAT domain-containing protein n=1 Tax=Streptomyces justiciae TaxID=2780140 RepID=UPI0021186191|nr:CHAT domain-containing protein [Streptomyces justiciae]MCW8382407.1 CHAT domain-containing protein [Streptomyces justiciae]
MSEELPVRVVQDPSRYFTALPDEMAQGPDIVVSLDVLAGERIRARLYGPAVPSEYGTEHRADLTARPADVRAAAARLCRLWKELLVGYTPPRGNLPAVEYPYASLVDLRSRPPGEQWEIVEELALAGKQLLFGILLGGSDPRVHRFGAYLAQALSGREGLRVRFDSELYLPWTMVCLRPDDVPVPTGTLRHQDPMTVYPRFLGYRHQIEQTGGAYPCLSRRREVPDVLAVSLNHDTRLDRKDQTRAAEVAALLAKGTDFVERTTRSELRRALSDAGLREHLMYFWCHGDFIPNGAHRPSLALRLTDRTAMVDAHTVRECRQHVEEGSPFQPFVMLNACHAAMPAEGGDPAFLGVALIQAGAQGVLGPQIEMPQVFAAEYALEFLTRYLRGSQTAGAISCAVARYFADELHNPLGIAYTLHCGMDARLERAESAESFT